MWEVLIITEMNDRERIEYAELLKKLLVLVPSRKLPTVVSSMLGDSGEMHSRFITLEMYEKRAHQTYYGIFAVLGLLFLLSYFVLLQPARLPSEVDVYEQALKPESFILENEDSYRASSFILQESSGKYRLYMNGHAVGFISEEALSLPPSNTLPIIKGES